MKNILKSALSIWLIISLILYPDIVISSASDALATCFNILLPSLFPFFVLSKMFIGNGGAEILGKIFNPVMRPLFGINGCGASSFILGIISGYPIGAKTAADLYKHGEISKQEAENLICFCNNSGPLFIIGAIGAGMMSSVNIGIFLYSIHILSAITLGIAIKFFIKQNNLSVSHNLRKKVSQNIFVNAVESSVISLINIFAYVIFFAIIMDVCDATNIFTSIENFAGEGTKPIIFSIFEMTTGIKKLNAAKLTFSTKIILTSFMLGWSGLSICFQTKSILDSIDISFKKYISAKLTHGVIAAIYTYLALKIVRLDISVFSNIIPSLHNYSIPLVYLSMPTLIIGIIYITALHHSAYNSRYSKPRQRRSR